MRDSRKLLDYWLPPDAAGRPVGCVATSFTFDPDFFEGDCLARFLGLSWKRGEGDDLAFLIDKEERLAEVRATVVVDRSLNPEGRSLRWDVLPVGLRGGVQHAKVSLLVWERLVRVIVSSANLTAGAYRSNAEAAAVLDAFEGSELPATLFVEVIDGLRTLVRRSAGDEGLPGPKRRALEALRDARQRVTAFGLPERSRGEPRVAAVFCEPGRPALDQLDAVWRGGPARCATVLSPFFDDEEHAGDTVAALVDRLARRGDIAIEFVLPVDTGAGGTLARAPRALQGAVPSKANVIFRAFQEDGTEEIRHLHAKALLLENDEWVALMIGSSNFTGPGLGIHRGRGNLEANLAFGVSAGSREAKAFRKLFGNGEVFDPESVEWAPVEDDEVAAVQLPWGFLECLFEPGPEAALLIRLDPSQLPDEWRIEWPSGSVQLSAEAWRAAGESREVRSRLPSAESPPFVVAVHWRAGDVWEKASWSVNVTDPGRLAPPEELRDLRVDALIQALASTRPLPEALAQAVQGALARSRRGDAIELDPLRRFEGAGLLLQRARRVAFALSGLRQRLEKPTNNLDALTWRLEGPFGPRALGEGLAKEASEGRLMEGELDFLLAEISLTLTRVDWKSVTRTIPQGTVHELVQATIVGLDALRRRVGLSPQLQGYVDAAFREAMP